MVVSTIAKNCIRRHVSLVIGLERAARIGQTAAPNRIPATRCTFVVRSVERLRVETRQEKTLRDAGHDPLKNPPNRLGQTRRCSPSDITAIPPHLFFCIGAIIEVMFNRILFPTDGSDGAAAALDHLVDLATHHDATVHILNVADTAQDSALQIQEDDVDAHIPHP